MKIAFLGLSILSVAFVACSKDEVSGGNTVPPVVAIDTVLHKMMPFSMGASLQCKPDENQRKIQRCGRKRV